MFVWMTDFLPKSLHSSRKMPTFAASLKNYMSQTAKTVTVESILSEIKSLSEKDLLQLLSKLFGQPFCKSRSPRISPSAQLPKRCQGDIPRCRIGNCDDHNYHLRHIPRLLNFRRNSVCPLRHISGSGLIISTFGRYFHYAGADENVPDFWGRRGECIMHNWKSLQNVTESVMFCRDFLCQPHNK